MDDELTTKFSTELRARGGELVETLGEDTHRVRIGDEGGEGGEAVVCLDNLRRELERGGDLDSAVETFVGRLLAVGRRIPDWPLAKPGLRWAFESRSVDLRLFVHRELTEQLAVVLAFSDEDEQLITLVSPPQLKRWGISLDEAQRFALENMDRLLAETEIEVDEVRGAQLGMLATHSAFKASLLLAPSLRARVIDTLGWPLLAVAPCRDFAYLFTDRDLLGPMAKTVVREHSDGAYPLSTEVLRIDDDGITAIGGFGAKGSGA